MPKIKKRKYPSVLLNCKDIWEWREENNNYKKEHVEFHLRVVLPIIKLLDINNCHQISFTTFKDKSTEAMFKEEQYSSIACCCIILITWLNQGTIDYKATKM